MKNLSITFFAIMALVFTACPSNAQQNKQMVANNAAAIQVIQFHSAHRCVTCLKIETLTRTTLAASYRTIPFRLVNVDDKNNAKMAEQFQANGTALFLYNPKTGKKKDLTDFAFMRAGDDKKFAIELKKHIEDFIRS